MNVLVFYRSKEWTNSIISSTRSKIESEKINNLCVDYLNLDKRNYQKYLKVLELLPDEVYLWYDEELVTDYIAENYPNIKIHHFDKKSINFPENNNSWGHYGYERRTYKLAEEIIENYKNGFKNVKMYFVDMSNFKVVERQISEFDWNNNKIKDTLYGSKDLAEQKLIEQIKSSIKRNEEAIESYNKMAQDCKKYLTTLNKRIKQLESE